MLLSGAVHAAATAASVPAQGLHIASGTPWAGLENARVARSGLLAETPIAAAATFSGNTGDIIPVSLGTTGMTAESRDSLLFVLVTPAGDVPLAAIRQPTADGSVALELFVPTPEAPTVGRVLFSESVEGNSAGQAGPAFSQTGRFYFAPEIENGKFDQAVGNYAGFSGRLRGEMEVAGGTTTFDIAVNPGYAGSIVTNPATNKPAVEGSNLYNLWLEQRLRFFGYRDELGNPISPDGILDGSADELLFRYNSPTQANVTKAIRTLNGEHLPRPLKDAFNDNGFILPGHGANGKNPPIVELRSTGLQWVVRDQKGKAFQVKFEDAGLNVYETNAETSWAIGLFNQVVKGPTALGKVASPTTTLSDLGKKFINASNAPRWVELPTGGAGWTNVERLTEKENHHWGTSWLAEIIGEAGKASQQAGSPTLLLDDASEQSGGEIDGHASHEIGIDVDVNDPFGVSDGKQGPYFFQTLVSAVDGQRYVAAQGGQLILYDEHTKTYRLGSATDPTNAVRAFWADDSRTKVHEDESPLSAWDNEAVLRQIAGFLLDNPDVDGKPATKDPYVLSTMRAQIKAFTDQIAAPRTKSLAKPYRVYFNDPRTWDLPSVKFQKNHGGHFHVRVQPPRVIPGGQSVALTEVEQQNIVNGLDGTANWMGGVHDVDAVNKDVQGIGSPFQKLTFHDGLRRDLAGLVTGYFESTDVPTLEGLTELLSAQQWITTVASSYSAEQNAIEFSLVYNASADSQIPLNVAAQFESLGLHVDGAAAVNLVANADFSFSFGLQLGDDVDPAEAFYIKPEKLTLRANIDASDVSLGVTTGFLSAEVEGGAVKLAAQVDLAFSNLGDDGRLTLSDLSSTTFASAIDVTSAGQFDALLPIQATIGETHLFPSDVLPTVSIHDGTSSHALEPDGDELPDEEGTGPGFGDEPGEDDPESTASSDLFDEEPPDIQAENLDQFSTFRAVDAKTVLAQLEQLASTLGNFDDSSSMAGALPLLQGATLKDIASIGELFQKDVLPLLESNSGQPSFQTVQQLADQLASVLVNGDPSLAVAYDPFTRELVYRMHAGNEISRSDTLEYTLNQASGISGVALNAEATTQGNLSADLTFGLDLDGAIDGADPMEWAFIRNASALTNLNITAADIDASARFGFLGVGVVDGTATLTPQVQLLFNDPGTLAPDGRIDLKEMMDAVAADPSSLASIDVTGQAQLTLPISAPAAGINPSPGTSIQIALSDIDEPQSLTVTVPPSLVKLAKFDNVTPADVLAGLAALPGLLRALATGDALGTKLPLIGTSLQNAILLADKLQAVIDGLSGFNTLQELETTLEAGLGNDVDVTVGVNDVRFALSLTDAFDHVDYGIGETLNGAAGLSVSGQLNAAGSAKVDLQFGLSLAAGLSAEDRFFLTPGPQSKAELGLLLNASSLTATGSLGFLKVGVAGGTAIIAGATGGNPDPSHDATLKLSFQDPGTTPDGRITLAELLADPVKVFTKPAIDGAIEVVLPLTAVGIDPGPATPKVTLKWSSLANPASLQIKVEDLDEFLARATQFDASSVLAGLQTTIDLLGALSGIDLLKQKLPLLDVDVVTIFNFADEVAKVLRAIDAPTNDPNALDLSIRNAVAAANLKFPDNAALTASSDPLQHNPGAGLFRYNLAINYPLTDLEATDFGFSLGGDLFDLNAKLTPQVQFTSNLGFGFSPIDGFFLAGGAGLHEMTVAVKTAATFDRIGGKFGPLQYGVSNGTADVDLGLSVDLVDLDRSGKITTDELVDLGAVVDPSFSGTASVVLPMGLRLGTPGVATTGPGITTSFSAYWDGGDPTQFHFGSPNGSTSPADGFGPVAFDLGEFVQTTIGPVVERINEFNPLPSSIVTLLKTKLPVIDKTPLDVMTGDSKGIKLLFDALSLAKEFQSLATTSRLDLSAYFKEESAPVLAAGTGDVSVNQVALNDFLAKLKNLGVTLQIIDSDNDGTFDAGSIIDVLLGNDIDLIRWNPQPFELKKTFGESFPILTLGIPWLANVSVNGDISGAIRLFGDLDMGLSTRGLREGVANILDGFFIGDNVENGQDNFEVGFGVSVGVGVSGSGQIGPLNIVKVRGGGGLEGLIGIDLADYNPNGVSPSDKRVGRKETGGDGRIFLDELASLRALNYPAAALVSVEGTLNAFLEASARAGCAFGYCLVNKHTRKDFTIGSLTLFDPEPPQSPKPGQPTTPVLAELQSDGTLQLNMGSRATLRKVGNTVDGNETFIVTHTGGTLGSETIAASAFGLTQEFSGVTSIVGDGGSGNDTILVQIGTESSVQLWGDFRDDTGDGDDHLLSFSSGGANLKGGGGRDYLVGGSGADNISGGGGDDSMSGGAGDDQIAGGTGNDEASGDAGNDEMAGDAGSDSLEGNDGNDKMEGDDGSDFLFAGDGTDTLVGSDGADEMYGQEGNDEVDGGDGDDYVEGGSGSDELMGGNGDDDLIGGASTAGPDGADLIDGGDGDDSIVGDNGTIDPDGSVIDTGGGSGSDIIDFDGEGLSYLFTDTNLTTLDREPVDYGAVETLRLSNGTFITEGDIFRNVVTGPNAILGGSGIIRRNVTANAGATVNPGDAGVGTITFGNTTFARDAKFAVDLEGPLAGQYDQLNILGTINLAGADLAATLSYVPESNETLIIVHNDDDDPIIGTFVQGRQISLGGVQFGIDYAFDGDNDGDSNDVALIRLADNLPTD